MVKWSSPTPQSDQQPTTPAIRATFSVMETAPALVKLMESGLEAHPFVNVSEYICMSSLLGVCIRSVCLACISMTFEPTCADYC